MAANQVEINTLGVLVAYSRLGGIEVLLGSLVGRRPLGCCMGFLRSQDLQSPLSQRDRC